MRLKCESLKLSVVSLDSKLREDRNPVQGVFHGTPVGSAMPGTGRAFSVCLLSELVHRGSGA